MDMTDTTTLDPSNVTATVDAYLSMWNEEDPGRRTVLIEAAWAPDGSYVDPLLEANGHDGLSEMVAAVHRQYPGHRFSRQSGVDVHHGELRFGWQLTAPDGTVTVAGIDVGRLAPDGRLAGITGFFGELPACEAA
jgi:hypothetical protein